MNPDVSVIEMLAFGKMVIIESSGHLSVFIDLLLVGGVIVVGLFCFWLRHKNSKTDSKDDSQHNYKLHE